MGTLKGVRGKEGVGRVVSLTLPGLKQSSLTSGAKPLRGPQTTSWAAGAARC